MAWVLLFLSFVSSVSTFSGFNQQQCNFCLSPPCTATVTGIPAANFMPTKDAKNIKKATRGILTDEDTLINILTKRTDYQRQTIAAAYLNLTGSTLVQAINRATYLSLRKFLTKLATPQLRFYTEELHRAIQDKDRRAIVEILTSLPSCAIRQISTQYLQLFKSTLSQDLEDFCARDAMLLPNNDCINVVKGLAHGHRDQSTTVNNSRAKRDANNLKMRIGDYFTSSVKKIFLELFTKRSIPQLREILRQYQELRTKEDAQFISLENDIERIFSGYGKDVYVGIARNVMDQPLYFAKELEDALDMWRSAKITRILRGRSDIDLQNIKQSYLSFFNKSLVDKIKEKPMMWPNYRKALLAILNANS